MAEFTEVMRQRKRMCDDTYCDTCGLSIDCNGHNVGCAYFTVNYYDDAEKIIMDWAAAHPEPQYPTWIEWQKERFPSAYAPLVPCIFISKKQAGCEGKLCSQCQHEPIPAEIAEKLGVKLKEGR